MHPNNGEVPISSITGIPGWETQAEENQLMFYASQVQPGGQIVEIGAEYGRSAGAFLAGSDPSVKVMSVDLFPKNHHLVGNLLDAYHANLVEARADTSRISVTISDSGAAALAWSPDNPIDLLFIDGDHTYEGVKRDLEWLRFVKPGGIVAFHDVAVDETSHPLHKEVLRAVEEAMHTEEYIFESQTHSLRIYRKAVHADEHPDSGV